MRDADVRGAVRQHLRCEHADDASTLIVEEMGLWSGSVRIDIAVINGELSGFELKSDRDTLQRLPFQAEIYSRIFDRVDLVVGERHLREGEKMVPDWWGVRRATSSPTGVVLETLRIGARNPTQESFLLAQLLWKEEAVAVG